MQAVFSRLTHIVKVLENLMFVPIEREIWTINSKTAFL